MKAWPHTPIAAQSHRMVGEVQELDGSWSLIAGPSHVREVIRLVAAYRVAAQAEGSWPETRVREDEA